MYTQRPDRVSANLTDGRIIRYIAMILTLFLPAFYIASTTFQNQMLPVEMALSIQKAKENVPFSSGFEVMGLLIAFEILIEALFDALNGYLILKIRAFSIFH